jgi:hypothetical protein
MVQADSQLKLLPTSILDIHKLSENIHMVSMGIWHYLKQLYPHYLAHILGVWVTCVIKMM